ncbi:MAG: helix-turn-helix transcriptional regulator [Clostridia bacterium]|nr:helix-turn-helix transcriptional regulator [Clostridia bacterium]
MTVKDIIQRIGYFRTKSNLSARELSLRIGKHDGYINKLESQDFNLPTSVLLEIIDALDITIEEFFCWKTNYNPETKEIIEKLAKLSNSNRQTILDLINKLQ